MNELQYRVSLLTDTELVEAATFYLPDVLGTADPAAVDARLSRAVESIGGDMTTLRAHLARVKDDRDAYRYLLRQVLSRAAAGTEEERRRLSEALDGLNQSQVVVEVMFAISAAAIVTLVWLAIPPTETTTTTVSEQRPDGSVVTTTTVSEKEIPPPIKDLFGWINGLTSGTSA